MISVVYRGVLKQGVDFVFVSEEDILDGGWVNVAASPRVKQNPTPTCQTANAALFATRQALVRWRCFSPSSSVVTVRVFLDVLVDGQPGVTAVILASKVGNVPEEPVGSGRPDVDLAGAAEERKRQLSAGTGSQQVTVRTDIRTGCDLVAERWPRIHAASDRKPLLSGLSLLLPDDGSLDGPASHGIEQFERTAFLAPVIRILFPVLVRLLVRRRRGGGAEVFPVATAARITLVRSPDFVMAEGHFILILVIVRLLLEDLVAVIVVMVGSTAR